MIPAEIDRILVTVVSRELAGSRLRAAHLDDIVSEARLRLLRKLRSLEDGAGDPIDDLSSYAATVAERTCYAFFRRQWPERTRLRNRIRYAVSHHPATTLARNSDGRWLCAARHRAAAAAGAGDAFIERPAAWLLQARIDVREPLPGVVAAILARLDRPIEIDRLVDALADVLGIAAAPIVVADQDDDRLAQVPDTAGSASDTLELRESLQRVWREITTLPARQRAALLLNLRDPDGGAVLHLLPATGVVSMDAIATALGTSLDRLTRIWPRLPFDDMTVARLLGITRQQVINLRKAARARLVRRIGATLA